MASQNDGVVPWNAVQDRAMAAFDDCQGEFLDADTRLPAGCRDMMRFEPQRDDGPVFHGEPQTLEAAVQGVIEDNKMMDRAV
jgi:hypothetical protein